MTRLLPANPRRRADRAGTDWVGLLMSQCRYGCIGLPEPVREYRFHPIRRWRADLCFVGQRLIVEVDGGTWLPGGGRHNRPAGFAKDLEKTNAMTLLGYRLLRFTPAQVASGEAKGVIAAALAAPDAGAGARTRGEG